MAWLDPDFPHRFRLFTPAHVVTMLLVAAVWVVVPVLCRRRCGERGDRAFRRALAAVLLGQHLLWVVWELAVGRFSVALSLPLNLCDASNILCAVLLLTKHPLLFEVLYFWALAGAIQSFVTPNVYYAFPHLEFFVFYIQHGGEILSILYLTLVAGMRPRALSMVKSFACLVVLIGLVYLFNLLTGSNYMFLMADTPVESTVSKMIRMFGAPPRHILGLGLVAAVSILVLYAPFAAQDLLARLRAPQHTKKGQPSADGCP